CSMAVAAMRASGRRMPASRRRRPARSATCLSTTSSRKGASSIVTSSPRELPANSSARVTTEEWTLLDFASNRASPRRWSTKTSVSIKPSATLPLGSRRTLEVHHRAEARAYYCIGINLLVQVAVEGPPSHLGHRQSLGRSHLLDPSLLGIRQIDLGPRGHTAQYTARHRCQPGGRSTSRHRLSVHASTLCVD